MGTQVVDYVGEQTVDYKRKTGGTNQRKEKQSADGHQRRGPRTDNKSLDVW